MIPSDDIKRQVVPRWRSIQATKDAGEFGSASKQRESEADKSVSGRLAAEFALRVQEWRAERDIACAEELIAIATVSGQTSDADVIAAAEFVLKDRDVLSGSRELAELIFVAGPSQEDRVPEGFETAKVRLELARRKRLLRLYPRDALLLTETALLYTNLGMTAQAGKLLRSAFGVAPNNRYVLRSLTRFLVHAKKPDLALDFLNKSSALQADPWLLAAFLAAEDVAGKTTNAWRQTKRLLSEDRFSDFELAELRAAAGTLHLEAGSHKLARKMFRSSMTEPTENAVAQAHWANRRDSSIDVVQGDVAPNAFEALAWEQQLAGNWRSTLDAVSKWLDLEPFSVRPAVVGSFVSVSHLGDGKAGEDFSRRGLIANKGDSTLHNNLAVSYAIQGKLQLASAELDIVKFKHGTPEEAVNLATRGLIQMRAGAPAEGVRLYNEAMQLALKLKNRILWSRAAAFFLFEASRYDKSELDKRAASVMKVYDSLSPFQKATADDIPALLQRARDVPNAAEMLEKLSAFRDNFLAYPVDNES